MLDEPFVPTSVPVSPAFDASAAAFVPARPASGSGELPVAVVSTTLQLELSGVTSNGTAAERDNGPGSAYVVEPSAMVTLEFAVSECARTSVVCAETSDDLDYGATYDDGYADGYASASASPVAPGRSLSDVASAPAAAPAAADDPCSGGAKVTDCKPPAADAWLLVVAVDKAWLELQPYSQPELEEAFSVAAGAAGELVHTLQNYLPPSLLSLWLEVRHVHRICRRACHQCASAWPLQGNCARYM